MSLVCEVTPAILSWAQWACFDEDDEAMCFSPTRKDSSPMLKADLPAPPRTEEERRPAAWNTMPHLAGGATADPDLQEPRRAEEARAAVLYADDVRKIPRPTSATPAKNETIPDGPCKVMLCNLPNRAKHARIDVHLRDLGFPNTKLHLPIDCRTGVNKGYAFVQLPDPRTARRFCETVDGTQLPCLKTGGSSTSDKRLQAVFAAQQEPGKKRERREMAKAMRTLEAQTEDDKHTVRHVETKEVPEAWLRMPHHASGPKLLGHLGGARVEKKALASDASTCSTGSTTASQTSTRDTETRGSPKQVHARPVGIPEILPFEQQEYFLTNTFVAVPDDAPAGARRRTRSSPPSVSVPVTVMLRNLPNRAKSAKVLEHVKDLGFPSFKLHVPIDCRSGVNKGYCFVQLPNMDLAAKFCSAVDQTQLPASGSTKKLHAMFACDQRCRFTWKEVRVVRKGGQTEVQVK